jgi:N-hydroxyarylamine O-acetyltransferase
MVAAQIFVLVIHYRFDENFLCLRERIQTIITFTFERLTIMTQVISNSTLTDSAQNRDKFDLEGYFKRIDYTGSSAKPNLETLREIHVRHAQSIPFENLNPFLGIPVVLDVDSLYKKLVLSGRGGYCFEHNLLLMHVLKSVGFAVKGLGARVLWNVPDGTITARGHMLLLIEMNGTHYIADVGFGGLTLTAPLELKADVEQQTPHETFKITHTTDNYILRARVQGAWKSIYSFGLQEQFLPDYEVTSWYLSNHPTSHFVTGLIAALPFAEGRHTLRNTDFATHYLDGSHDRRRFASATELKDVLKKIFGVNIPEIASIDTSLEKILPPKSPT